MAQLKDLLVAGASRFIGDVYANKLQLTSLSAPTSAGGTTYGVGTNGNYLRTNGTSLYWDALDAADVPALSTDKLTSGTLGVERGGTGKASWTQWGVLYASASTTLTNTAAGAANTALMGKGSAAPAFVSVSTTLATSTAATASAGQKLKATVLGVASSEVELSKATNALYGVTKLTDSYSSTDGTMATTGKALLAAIQTLDVSSVGNTNGSKYIAAISETDGKISATAVDVATTYSATGTTAISGTGVAAALGTLDVSAVGVAAATGNRFISQISETDGKISATLATATIGANAKPVYINSGTITASTATVGTLYNPVYMNAGTITASSGYTVEYIVGTQTAATGAWTGVTKDAALYDGKMIMYVLPYAGSGNATLNLTLSGGTTTGAKNIYRYGGTTAITTHYAAGSRILLIYDATNSRWNSSAWYDSNTNTAQRTYRSSTNIELPIAGINTSASVTAAYAEITSGSYKDVYGAIPEDTTKVATINPSTGKITVVALQATTINGVTVGSSPKFTDTNTYVTQTATTTDASYEVLFSATADNTTRTEGARKDSKLTFNPSSGDLTSKYLTATNDVTIGSWCYATDGAYNDSWGDYFLGADANSNVYIHPEVLGSNNYGTAAPTSSTAHAGGTGSLYFQYGTSSSSSTMDPDVDKIYPVGSIYISTSSANPSTFFGGTWEAISGRFLLGANSTYTGGSTGGAATVTLTTSQIPAHTHGSKSLTGTLSAYTWATGSSGGIVSKSTPYQNMEMWSGSSIGHNTYTINATHTHDSVGGGTAHENMPPYLAVYIWKRTS